MIALFVALYNKCAETKFPMIAGTSINDKCKLEEPFAGNSLVLTDLFIPTA